MRTQSLKPLKKNTTKKDSSNDIKEDEIDGMDANEDKSGKS